MFVSEQRVAANRRNAQRSTGPKTAEGKERSRANALKHGLCSSKLVSEDLELVEARADEWYSALCPQTRYQRWLIDEMAILSLRVDRVERIERRARDHKALRAELFWEDDRKLLAIRMGSMLQANPPEVVEVLRRTPQGCEWLMTRWAMLAHVADVKQVWTPEQTRLAFDLLGTPEEFREGMIPGSSIDFNGEPVEPTTDLAIIARREIAHLKARRDEVEELDQVEQSLAMADLHLQAEQDPDLKKLRRYEGTLHNRLRWFMKQFHEKPAHSRPGLILKNNWKGESARADEVARFIQVDIKPSQPAIEDPEPEPTPEEEPKPLRTHEEPVVIDCRVEKKLRKAEARRESRNRKAERLRA